VWAAGRAASWSARSTTPGGCGRSASEYLVAVDGVHSCLGLGSSVPEEDAVLFGEIADRFEILV
jgi:hypothetical protein